MLCVCLSSSPTNLGFSSLINSLTSGKEGGVLCCFIHCRRVVCAVFGAVGFSINYKRKKSKEKRASFQE